MKLSEEESHSEAISLNRDKCRQISQCWGGSGYIDEMDHKRWKAFQNKWCRPNAENSRETKIRRKCKQRERSRWLFKQVNGRFKAWEYFEDIYKNMFLKMEIRIFFAIDEENFAEIVEGPSEEAWSIISKCSVNQAVYIRWPATGCHFIMAINSYLYIRWPAGTGHSTWSGTPCNWHWHWQQETLQVWTATSWHQSSTGYWSWWVRILNRTFISF